jgi:hypothetical protein
VNDLAPLLTGPDASSKTKSSLKPGEVEEEGPGSRRHRPIVVTREKKRKTSMMTALLAGIGGFMASGVLISTLWYYTEIKQRRKYSSLEVDPAKLAAGIDPKLGKIKYSNKVTAAKNPLDEAFWNQKHDREEKEREKFQFQEERRDSLGSIGF